MPHSTTYHERAKRRIDLSPSNLQSDSLSLSPWVRRIARNFVLLGLAEVLCRGLSLFVTLSLTRRLMAEGFGRVEFAFNVVFWLVLIVRDCFETIITREIARHPRLTRGLVNHVLAVKLTLALVLMGGIMAVGFSTFANPLDGWVLTLYGLLLLSTALGLDFVFRGNESMGLVALSLFVRTSVYCAGVWCTVTDPSRILLVPVWLAVGEFTGIGLVWAVYSKKFGVPRPVFGVRFLLVFLRRGRSVGLIHLCQAVIVSADLLVIGLMSRWADVGCYGAPHRLVAAVMAFGMIVQQVIFPALSRSWRVSEDEGRRLLDLTVRVLVAGLLPVAVGGTVLAQPLVRGFLPVEYQRCWPMLALGIWRAPLLSLAFLYQSTLIATDRESHGLRLLACGALASAPLVALFATIFGLPGASAAVLLVGLGLVVAGYLCLQSGGCQPAAHHHLGKPLIAAAVMVPACLLASRVHVVLGVAAGAVVYGGVLKGIGGLDFRHETRTDAPSPGRLARVVSRA